MSRTRLALSTVVSTAIVLWFTPASGAAPPAANGSSPVPPGKPAEVSTVGSTAPGLTTAERLKFAQRERERSAPAVRPRGPARPAASLPPELLRKSLPFETRVPATGPRDRTKPVQGAHEVAGPEKGGRR